MTIKINKINPKAVIPYRATSGSAGYDICACIETELEIKPNETVLIPTGLAIELPPDTAGMIYNRSSLGIKHGLHLANGVGVIDSDYRGEFKVGIHNFSNVSYIVKPNERIAQLIIHKVLLPEFTEVDSLSETDRDIGGFGSTGKY